MYYTIHYYTLMCLDTPIDKKKKNHVSGVINCRYQQMKAHHQSKRVSLGMMHWRQAWGQENEVRENRESCRMRKSDDRAMKFDRRLNMTTLQSLSMKRPKGSVRLVILCPSAPCFIADQLEGRQLKSKRSWIKQIYVRADVYVCARVRHCIQREWQREEWRQLFVGIRGHCMTVCARLRVFSTSDDIKST